MLFFWKWYTEEYIERVKFLRSGRLQAHPRTILEMGFSWKGMLWWAWKWVLKMMVRCGRFFFSFLFFFPFLIGICKKERRKKKKKKKRFSHPYPLIIKSFKGLTKKKKKKNSPQGCHHFQLLTLGATNASYATASNQTPFGRIAKPGPSHFWRASHTTASY